MILYEIFVTFIFGAIVGSFLNVAILRLPEKDQSIVFPASHCPKCKTPLKWYDNIPIFSFLFLKGACRYCSEKISWQYPVIEACMGLISAALYLKFSLLPFSIYFVFAASLLVIIVIDFRHQIIPDVISIPGIFLGFAFALVNPHILWSDSGLGILFGGGSFYLLALVYYLLTKRMGMGGGDIKLLAMIGAFLGWQSLPFVIFSSSLFGTVAGIGAMIKQKKGGKTVIPYGPFLAIAALLYLFFDLQIQIFLHKLVYPS
jgi:leader peptidase (prepilin peptidase)/N-methyltransferase